MGHRLWFIPPNLFEIEVLRIYNANEYKNILGDSMIRDTPKLFPTHTGNLVPPSDRACGTIINEKNFKF